MAEAKISICKEKNLHTDLPMDWTENP